MAWRTVLGLLAVALAVVPPPARAAPGDAEATLRRLIGQDRATVERLVGPPDETESNGVQTFLRYRSFDSWRVGTRPDAFGETRGFSSSRGRANFDCTTTLVLVDGILRAYHRNGTGCR